jgi:DNA-binding response OmpR family regulator
MIESERAVLLIDDDPVTQELFSILLQPNGFHVDCASNPEEARRFLAAVQADLILLDLNLGGADGLALTRELRERLGPSTPLVVVSASSDAGMRHRALQSGATGFIAKPVNPRTFASELKTLMEGAIQAAREEELPERRLRELREQFLETAIKVIAELNQRSDQELLSDNLLADAAHKWVGASSIEGMPDVEDTARELETLARAKRTDQCVHIRRRLRWIEGQFQAVPA